MLCTTNQLSIKCVRVQRCFSASRIDNLVQNYLFLLLNVFVSSPAWDPNFWKFWKVWICSIGYWWTDKSNRNLCHFWWNIFCSLMLDWFWNAFAWLSDYRTTDVSILLAGNLPTQALHTWWIWICTHKSDDWSS